MRDARTLGTDQLTSHTVNVADRQRLVLGEGGQDQTARTAWGGAGQELLNGRRVTKGILVRIPARGGAMTMPVLDLLAQVGAGVVALDDMPIIPVAPSGQTCVMGQSLRVEN